MDEKKRIIVPMARRKRRKLKKSAFVFTAVVTLLLWHLIISGFRLRFLDDDTIDRGTERIRDGMRKIMTLPIRIRRTFFPFPPKDADQGQQQTAHVPEDIIDSEAVASEPLINEHASKDPVSLPPATGKSPELLRNRPASDKQSPKVQTEEEITQPARTIIKVNTSKYIYNPSPEHLPESSAAPREKADTLLNNKPAQTSKKKPAFDSMMDKSYDKITETVETIKNRIEKTTGFSVKSEKEPDKTRKTYSLEKDFSLFSLEVSPASDRLIRINKGEIKIDYVHDRDDQVRVGMETEF